MVSFSQAAGSYLLLLLVSVSWWLMVVLSLFQAFSWLELACFWWVELRLVLLVGRPMTKVEFWDGCKLKKTLNILSSDRRGCLSILLLFGLNKILFPALDPTGCWVGLGIGAKIETTERVHTNQYFLGPLLSASFSPVRYSWPSPLQETLQDP